MRISIRAKTKQKETEKDVTKKWSISFKKKRCLKVSWKLTEKKMDRITEEVITSLIKRVEALENKQTTPNQPAQNGIILASPEQISYIRGLGGNPWQGMSKFEATDLIRVLIARKQIAESHSESPKVTEPKEVDTDDAGLDSEGLL